MRILAVTGTRADWGLLAPVLACLRNDARFDLRLAATGQHLMAGSPSLEAIAAEGFVVDHRVDMGLGPDDSARARTRASGAALSGFADVLAGDTPDLMLVLGDRYEILAAVFAALMAGVPVAHLCGGDLTEGAMDDAIRHAITKMSALHFASNAEAAQRVRQMGEDPAHVFDVGSPGLDRIRQIPLMSRADLLADLGLPAPQGPVFVVTFHPVTLGDGGLAECRAMLDALDAFPEATLIMTGSNADPGAQAVDRMVTGYAGARETAVHRASLGSRRYFSALAMADAVIGNSSSGLYEAPSFSVPTVNIGDRQGGRLRGPSVIDCAPERDAIVAAIHAALAMDCSGMANPYGDGHSAARIVAELARIDTPRALARKSFRDIPA
jgi:UDP-hydrolysing UDP-N-acetyl-D-glucosamine 2-epimerase